jgi:hypothetical protein
MGALLELRLPSLGGGGVYGGETVVISHDAHGDLSDSETRTFVLSSFLDSFLLCLP